MTDDVVLAIWGLLGFLVLIWAGMTITAGARLPHVGQVAGFFQRSWFGRLLALAGWAYLGWHLFCQRP